MSKRVERNEDYLNKNTKSDKSSSRVKSSKNSLARERWSILRQVSFLDLQQ
jgi:hypothetical protein